MWKTELSYYRFDYSYQFEDFPQALVILPQTTQMFSPLLLILVLSHT